MEISVGHTAHCAGRREHNGIHLTPVTTACMPRMSESGVGGSIVCVCLCV